MQFGFLQQTLTPNQFNNLMIGVGQLRLSVDMHGQFDKLIRKDIKMAAKAKKTKKVSKKTTKKSSSKK